MAKRICVNCGKEKDIAGGKYCGKDHFTCAACAFGKDWCNSCKGKIR